jgi:hypothetical protein
VLALAATSFERAESANTEDLTQYGRKWEEIKTNWGSELDRHNTRMDELNRMPPGPERDGLINKEMQGHRTASQDMARQRQDIHDKVIEEVNRRTGVGQKAPDGRKAPEARQTEGTKITDPKHRGIPGDTDVGGTATQADKVKQVLKDMGIKAEIKTTPSTVEVGDDFNFTVNKEGKLSKPGSGAHQVQVHVDARNKETYISEGMDKGQAGRDYVQVQDHKKKAMGGLKSNPEDLARHPDTARDMVKGTSKTMDHLSDAEISEIMKKNNMSGTPQDFRDQMKAIKEGRAAVTSENAAKLQQASRDVFDKAEIKTKTKADHEVARTREKIEQLEKAGAKKTAQELREKLADSREKISETGAANKEAARKGPSETAGKSTNEASSRKPAGPAEPTGKAPAGEPSGQTAGKASSGPTAKGQKSSVEPSSVGKTTTTEPSAPKGERGLVTKSATNKPSTPEEWRRWNEQRVPESVKQKGPGIPESNTGRDFVEGLPKNPTDPGPSAKKPFGSGMTPEQKAVYDKLIKEGVPHRAPPGKPAPPESSGPKAGQTPSEPIAEPAGKSGKTTPEPTAKGGKTPGKMADQPSATGKSVGQSNAAKTEVTSKGQAADAPKGKGQIADAPDGKPRAPNAPEGKPGTARKALDKIGKGMIAVDIFSGAEDFKEAAKQGDAEGMKRAAVNTADSLTGGVKGTYDTITTKAGDASAALNAIDQANRMNEESHNQRVAIELQGAGVSKDEIRRILDAKAKGDNGPMNSKFAKIGKPVPIKIVEKGPTGDDAALDRAEEVIKGMVEKTEKAGKFLNDTRKDLTEIGTGLAEKNTRDAVIEQVQENVSIDNMRVGIDARNINNKANTDRAAARKRLEDKLVEKGASRDEAAKAVRAWDEGDRSAVNELKERIRKDNSQNLPVDPYDPRGDPNLITKGVGSGSIDIAQADRASKEFQQHQGGGGKSATAQNPQNVTRQPESYTTDPGNKPDAPDGTAQMPFSPHPSGYPPNSGSPGVRIPWDTLSGSSGYGTRSPSGSGGSRSAKLPKPPSASSGTPPQTTAPTSTGKTEPTPAELKAAYNEGCMVGKQVRNGELSSTAVKELIRTKYDQGHQALKNEFRRGWGDCQQPSR